MTVLEAVNFPARRPITALVILAALTVAAVFAVRGLKPDVSLQGMMSSRDASALALDRVFNDFAAVDELLVMASVPESSPADPDRLIRFAEQLEQAISKDPAAGAQVTAVRYRPDPKTRDFFQSVFAPNGMFYLTDDEYAQARQRLTRAGMAEQFQRNEQLISTPGPAAGALSKAFVQDPLRLHEYMLSRLSGFGGMEHFGSADALLSTDQRSLLIRIRGAKPPGDLEFAKEMTASVSRAVQKANTDGLEIDLSGAYAIAAHSASAIRRDSIISVNTSVICMAILFLLVYRNPLRLFAIAMVPVAMGILYGFGVYAMFRPTITPLTAVIGGALAGIGIDYSIHYLTFYDSRRHLGRSALESTAATIRTMGTLQLAGWATSVVGFLATALSTVKALRDFALAGSLGLAGVFICTLVMHPAILVLTDRGRSSMAASRLDLTRIVRWTGRNCAIVVGASCLFMLIPLAWLIHDRSVFDLESDMTILHPRPNPPLDAQKKISQRMGTSPDTLLVHLKADSSEKLVELAHDVQARLTSPEARAAGVSGAFGLATVLPDPRLAARRIAETGPEYAKQVLADFDTVVADSMFSASAFEQYREFLKILLTQTKPPGLDALEPYTEIRQTLLPRDGSPPQATQAVTLLFIGDSLDTRASRERVLDLLRSQLHDLPGATLTGIAVINQDMDATIRRDLPWLIGAALIFVGVYLVAQFRSIADTFLALLPVMFSLSCVLGAMELTGQRLNLANIVAVPLLIGIDVDYGIFLVGVARRSHDRDELVADLSTISQGIVLCASTALLGFGAIYFTSVPAIQSLGLAVSVGIVSCMMGSILLLTPILLLRGPRAAAIEVNQPMNALRVGFFAILVPLLGAGCAAPSARLTFPRAPIKHGNPIEWYDVNRDGKPDFALHLTNGRVESLYYDDDEDGNVDRIYHLAGYANAEVPHFILLLDSIPFETMKERYDAGEFRWFDPPQKTIGAFLSLTELCYSDVLRCPPRPGMIDGHYDPRVGEFHDLVNSRIVGYREPYEQRLNYVASLKEIALAYLDPKSWLAAEAERCRVAVDDSLDRVCIAYIGSASGMVCRFGRPGAEETLDVARQLCLQLLYERRGAIKISMMADHGHNYAPSKMLPLDEILRKGGFNPTDRIRRDNDVVLEPDGLVSGVSYHTHKPVETASVLLKDPGVELAVYLQQDRAIVRSAAGSAAIEYRNGMVRYVPIDADVLDLEPVIHRLQQQGMADSDGFVSDRNWFEQTLDHQWPNAPRRIWDALHRQVYLTPTVLLSLKDGVYYGLSKYENYINMLSTHGGLNQMNSATFVMSMTGRMTRPTRQVDLLQTLEPGFEPRLYR